MKKSNFSTSACRHCRFYEPEGRRGGSCQMLGVPVQSGWEACTFASPPFDTTLKKLEDIFHLEALVDRESSQNTSSEVPQLEIEDKLQTTVSNKLD